MFIMRVFLAGLLVVLFMTACAQKSMEHRGRIYCPACGVELDALFEKHY